MVLPGDGSPGNKIYMNAESLLHNLLGDADDESEKSVNGGAKG